MSFLAGKDPLDRIFYIALFVSFLVHLAVFISSGDLFKRRKTVIFTPYRVRLVGSISGRVVHSSGKKGGIKKRVKKNSSSIKKSYVKKEAAKKIRTLKTSRSKKISIATKKKRRKHFENTKRRKEKDNFNLAEIGNFINKLKKEESKRKNTSNGAGTKGNGGGGELLTGKALSFLQKVYFSDLAGRIKNAWILPPQLRTETKNLMVILAITISSDGNILKVVVEESSGNIFFDESAIRAVKKLGQLPPPPIEGKQITIGLRFHLRELQK